MSKRLNGLCCDGSITVNISRLINVDDERFRILNWLSEVNYEDTTISSPQLARKTLEIGFSEKATLLNGKNQHLLSSGCMVSVSLFEKNRFPAGAGKTVLA
ncbi:hypothetical protein RUND412_002438 [Rhizina undulata]